jgi:mono/diheme cytochrome c family protein
LSAYLTQKYPPTEATNPPMPEAVAMAEPSDDGGEAGADTGGAAAEAGSDTGPTEASGDETGAEVAVEPKAKPKPRRSRGPRKPRSVAASDDAGVADDAGDEPAKPKAPAADANVGRALFLAKCKTCHGADGKGDTAFGRKLEIEPLSGLGVARIKSAVTDGVPGTKMKAYGGQLTAEEIADVAAFVKRL